MSESLSQVILHVIFSTKNRIKSIDPQVRNSLHAYMATALRDLGWYVYRVGGTSNHIHAACTLPRTLSQSELTDQIKPESSNWIKKQGPAYNGSGGRAVTRSSRSAREEVMGSDHVKRCEENG